MFFDYYYLVLVMPAILFALWAQAQVSGTFAKFSKVRTMRGLTGAQAAEAVLRAGGVYDVRIERISGIAHLVCRATLKRKRTIIRFLKAY